MQNVGVIGGADGPTAIFLSGSGVTMSLLALGAAVLALGVVAIIVYAARK